MEKAGLGDNATVYVWTIEYRELVGGLRYLVPEKGSLAHVIVDSRVGR